MGWIPLILNVLLKPKESASFVITRSIGYLFLIVGLILGLVFFFQFLVPYIGYLETGALFCAIFFTTGFLFLFLGRKKPTRPIDDLMGEAQRLLRESEVDKIIRENAPKILLFSLAAGFILSQVKDITRQFRGK